MPQAKPVSATPTAGIIKAAQQCLPKKKPPSLQGGLRVLSKQVGKPDAQQGEEATARKTDDEDGVLRG